MSFFYSKHFSGFFFHSVKSSLLHGSQAEHDLYPVLCPPVRLGFLTLLSSPGRLRVLKYATPPHASWLEMLLS